MSDSPCLLWDIDGTLIDTTSLIVASLDHIYQRFFHKILSETEIRSLIGTPLKSQIRIFGEPEEYGHSAEEVIETCIAYYETHRSQEHVLSEVTALLREGKERGLPTALVTSKNRPELQNTLPRLDIEQWVDFAITADDVPRPKPAPDGLIEAMDRFSIPPELRSNVFYIGDTTHDMEAAQAAGVRGIAVLWGAALRPSLEALSPYALCETPQELKNILFG